MTLSDEKQKSYGKIIDGILAISDLDKVSSKQIRNGLQKAVGHDISAQKDDINKLIVSRFDAFREGEGEEDESQALAAANGPTKAQTNGTKPSRSVSASPAPKRSASSSDPEVSNNASPPKKKTKRPGPDADAALAARLQAEEDSRQRPTRKGATKKQKPSAKPKSTPRKQKSSTKVKAEDDSEVDTGSEDDKPVKRNGAFHKPLNLSEPLSQLLRETTLSRPQTVKKIWEYVREHDLQNPDDKRQILCDDAMRAVFKQDTVHMFTMNKILSKNLYPIEADE